MRKEKREAEEGTEEGTAPPVTAGLVLGAAGREHSVVPVAKAQEGALVLGAGVALAEEAALSESEFAGGFAAGGKESAGGAVFTAAVEVSGGVEDFGLSPAEGDDALTSSTGLFCKRGEETSNINLRICEVRVCLNASRGRDKQTYRLVSLRSFLISSFLLPSVALRPRLSLSDRRTKTDL